MTENERANLEKCKVCQWQEEVKKCVHCMPKCPCCGRLVGDIDRRARLYAKAEIDEQVLHAPKEWTDLVNKYTIEELARALWERENG